MLTMLISVASAATFSGEEIDTDLVADLVRSQDASDVLSWQDCSDEDDGIACVSIDLKTANGARTWALTDEPCTGTIGTGCYNGFTALGVIDHTLSSLDLSKASVEIETDIWVWESGAPVNTESVTTTMLTSHSGVSMEYLFVNTPTLAMFPATGGVISSGNTFEDAQSFFDCYKVFKELQSILLHTADQNLQTELESAGLGFTGLTYDESFSLWGSVKQNPGMLNQAWRTRLFDYINEQYEECRTSFEPLPPVEPPGVDLLDETCLECTEMGTETYDLVVRTPNSSGGYTTTLVTITEEVCMDWIISTGEDVNGDGFCD